MYYHTALDVSLRSASTCIVADEGTIQYAAKKENKCVPFFQRRK